MKSARNARLSACARFGEARRSAGRGGGSPAWAGLKGGLHDAPAAAIVRAERVEGHVKVFISWSGERSGQLATALQNWLPKVIQTISPWLSSANIEPGVRWSNEVVHALEETHCGVLCLTPENLRAAWILFEAGALSKAVSASRVIPLLLGFAPTELEGPFSQFQAVRADESGTLRLVTALNSLGGSPLSTPDMLQETFQVWWPRLQPQIDRLTAMPVKASAVPPRSVDNILAEILELLRDERRRSQSPHAVESTSAIVAGPNVTIGSIIRSLRTKAGWTPNELSTRARLPAPAILRIERGEALPTPTELRQMGRALGIQFYDTPPDEAPAPQDQSDD
jgi:hypothetical protein